MCVVVFDEKRACMYVVCVCGEEQREREREREGCYVMPRCWSTLGLLLHMAEPKNKAEGKGSICDGYTKLLLLASSPSSSSSSS